MRRKKSDTINQLRKSVGKSILIKVGGGKMFRGILLSYDKHLNLYLDDAVQIFEIENKDGYPVTESEEIGTVILRGSNIVIISLS